MPAFLALLGTLSCAAGAKDYVIAVEAVDYMPLYDGTDSRNYHGYSRDLFDLFSTKYGHRFQYVPFPVNRLFKEIFVAKNFDFKFPDNAHWQTDIKKGVQVQRTAS